MIAALRLALITPLCVSMLYSQTPEYANPPASFVDTMPPVLIRLKDSCGSRLAEVTELRNIPNPVSRIPADTDQVETGIAGIDVVDGSNHYNYRLIMHTGGAFPRQPSYKVFRYTWQVIDSLRDARVEYYVRDFYDNIVFDTVTYTAPTFIDTMPPATVQLSRDSLQWTFEATERRNDPLPENLCPLSGLQRESGLIRMYLDRFSFNLELAISPLVIFTPGTPTLAATYTVHVIDPQRRASGVVVTSDQAGNFWLDTLFYDRPTTIAEVRSAPALMSISPNPASSSCLVSWTRSPQPRMFELVDLHGRIVLSQPISLGESELRIDTSPLPKGSYAVRLTGPDGSATQRFIVR